MSLRQCFIPALALLTCFLLGDSSCFGQERYQSGKWKGFTSYTAFEIVEIEKPFTVREIAGSVLLGITKDPLGDVLVEIRDSKGRIRSTKTDVHGHFRFRGLQEGSYDFKTTLIGFSSVTGRFVIDRDTQKPDSVELVMPLGV